ncbi:hypothetical protein Tco_1095159 [Tanacetum coccineum]
MVEAASSSGTKNITSNPFDVLNMVEKDISVTPSDSFNSNDDELNVGKSKDVNLDNEDNDSENDVEEDYNEIMSFMASKSYKGTRSSKNGGGTERRVYMSIENMIMMIAHMTMMRKTKT